MALSKPLFVRLRDPEGRYLGGGATNIVFTRDVNSAVVFDCRRHDIEGQVEFFRLIKGIVLQAEPVDPKEIHETCDNCGRSALSFQIFFDGEHYLCSACRVAAPVAARHS